jgi:hypothetical protein
VPAGEPADGVEEATPDNLRPPSGRPKQTERCSTCSPVAGGRGLAGLEYSGTSWSRTTWRGGEVTASPRAPAPSGSSPPGSTRWTSRSKGPRTPHAEPVTELTRGPPTPRGTTVTWSRAGARHRAHRDLRRGPASTPRPRPRVRPVPRATPPDAPSTGGTGSAWRSRVGRLHPRRQRSRYDSDVGATFRSPSPNRALRRPRHPGRTLTDEDRVRGRSRAVLDHPLAKGPAAPA